MVDLDHLRELATGASPGPWRTDDGMNPGWVFTNEAVAGHVWERLVCRGADPSVPEAQREADGQYIAALDPQTLVELLDELATLRGRVAAAKQLCGAPTVNLFARIARALDGDDE